MKLPNNFNPQEDIQMFGRTMVDDDFGGFKETWTDYGHFWGHVAYENTVASSPKWLVIMRGVIKQFKQNDRVSWNLDGFRICSVPKYYPEDDLTVFNMTAE